MSDNLLMIAASEADSNLYYASRFLAPDSFVYLSIRGRSYLLMSDLEVDRARAQSRVDAVLFYSDLRNQTKERGIEKPREADVIHTFLLAQGVSELTVPDNFPLAAADALRALGITLVVKEEPFFSERAIKSGVEVAAIRAAQVAVEEAMDEIMQVLRAATIRDGLIYFEGALLSSESVRQRLHLSLMAKGCVAQHTIIACGADACDPHNVGAGPLRANEAIIFDIFPKSSDSRYFADMSRTVVKGRASDGLKRLYDTVLTGQELGIARVKNGASGKAIHEEIEALFELRGYKTGKIGGRMQGFFHGTGHGVGLDIHEPPRIGKSDWTLATGEVVTVEPGLYYPDIGAVRIEDMVLVQDDGCRNLTTYPKVLEVA
jgi:Xaa-Pro aminopeptidase